MGNDRLILEHYNYNSRTGIITWKKTIVGRGKNAVKVGDKVGSMSSRGYLTMSCRGTPLKTHRVAWFIYYGEWPKGQIDHINGIKTDNRIKNLRDVSNSENCKNKIKHRNGHLVGTTLCKTTGKWVAQIRINGKKIRIGRFKSKEKAHEEYMRFSNE